MGRDLTIETVTPGELSPDELDLWSAIVADDARYASPYFHPRFTQVAGEVAPGAAVAILHRRGEIVGFFPHQRRGGAVQPIAAPLNDYHGVILARGERVPLEALPDLLGAGSVSVNSWVGQAGGDTVAVRETLQADLTAGWDAYDAGRREAFRKYFRDKDRARRSLARDVGEVTSCVDSRDRLMLEHLIALKREQYRRSRRHDIFACGWTADLLRALLALNGDAGFGARLAVLSAGGEPIAYEYGLHAADRYHFWFPAYEAHVGRYSPGILLSLDTMRQASAEGFRIFDYGFVGEGYKKYFCDRSETVVEAVARADGRAGVFALPASAVGQSVRRRWAAIDACETTVVGRARGIASAAAAALNKSRGPEALTAVAAMMIL